MSNNSKRILSLLKILREHTDEKHPLKESDLKALLNNENISIANRKTIYGDIEVLSLSGFDIIYDTFSKGYYLKDAPFSFSEIRILCDCISSLNNIDAESKERIIHKLTSFISSYKADSLLNDSVSVNKERSPQINKKGQSYMERLEIILDCLSSLKKLSFSYNGKSQIALPYYLHYANDRYYLYVLFEDSTDSYSYRLDRMSNLAILDETFEFSNQELEKIKQKIRTSYDTYSGNVPEIILLQAKDYKAIEKRLKDDFPDHYLDNKGNIIIEYRPNEIFFSRLVSYGTSLKIVSPEKTVSDFLNYLESIRETY